MRGGTIGTAKQWIGIGVIPIAAVAALTLGVSVATAGICGFTGPDAAPATSPSPAAPPTSTKPGLASELKPFKQKVPSAAFEFDMLPIPGDDSKGIAPFFLGKTELTWEAFDVFVYLLDEGGLKDGESTPSGQSAPPQGTAPDAGSRPSKPYLPPDRGFGHDGYAAITLSFRNAQAFCAWLSERSGRKYRLPTEAEWEHAAAAGGSGPYGFPGGAAALADHAWFADNADGKTHAVASKKPNDWGLYDMHGNAAEWVVGRDGKPVLKGGSYLDGAESLTISARQPSSPAFNASDPQMPKSKWWLADGPFIGFRVVCETGVPAPSPTADRPLQTDPKRENK